MHSTNTNYDYLVFTKSRRNNFYFSKFTRIPIHLMFLGIVSVAALAAYFLAFTLDVKKKLCLRTNKQVEQLAKLNKEFVPEEIFLDNNTIGWIAMNCARIAKYLLYSFKHIGMCHQMIFKGNTGIKDCNTKCTDINQWYVT